MNSSLVLKGLSSGNLISLDMSYCGVSSSVLNSLHNLTSLQSLDLSYNQLTKTIPKSLGNLCNLRDLDLSDNDYLNISLANLLESFFECKSLYDNHIYGTIPASIGRLSFLRTLRIRSNLIFGLVPHSIGQLSMLEELDLSYNQLDGSLPESLGQLLKLESLDLSHNGLNGSLLESLGQLLKLESLHLSHNLLSGVVTEAQFAKLACLKDLRGGGNKLIFKLRHANWIPPFQLQYLYLNSWGLGPQFPLWLQMHRDLQELDISNTRISSPIPDSFWISFPNLTYLDMSHNHIQGTLSLMGMPATLDLNSNEFRGKLPNLSNNTSLRVLDLSSNFFVGSVHHFLCPYDDTSLLVANLGNNHLSGVIPECWEKWPGLQSLNMQGNKLTGRLPASLMNLTELKILQLGGNELVGSIPTWFGQTFSFLRILNLRSNNFDGDIPHELCYLTEIQILNLAHNNLSGTIPGCFNNFSVLSGKEEVLNEQIDFISRTNMVMSSDSSVMKGREDTYSTILGLVILLDLSSNNLVGHIPRETFDLSVNKLSWELHASLSSLTFLISFNVSYNNFTGRIPSSTQLQSFNESCFFGNKLCGDPLINNCAQVEVPDTHQEKDDDDESHVEDWGFIISIVCGFISEFWIVVAPLIVSRSWRIAFFRFLTEMRYMVYDVMHKLLGQPGFVYELRVCSRITGRFGRIC